MTTTELAAMTTEQRNVRLAELDGDPSYPSYTTDLNAIRALLDGLTEMQQFRFFEALYGLLNDVRQFDPYEFDGWSSFFRLTMPDPAIAAEALLLALC